MVAIKETIVFLELCRTLGTEIDPKLKETVDLIK